MIPEWKQAPKKLELKVGAIHVWRVELDVGAEALAELRRVLAADEQQRADRFRFEVDRHRFIAARATLRQLLARYLATTSAQVQFCYGDRGKPAIDQPGTDLAFNVAHSQNQMLCAITRQHRVGIDLEFLRDIQDLESLAQRFCQPAESAALLTLAKAQRPEAFFRLWTCKEAVLKAIGTGLVGLEQVELCLQADRVELLRLAGDRYPVTNWLLQSFWVEPGCAGAIACDSLDLQISFFQW